MKRFLRPKLILPIVTVVLLLGASLTALAGNFIGAHAQAPRTPLFIFLQGINTSLDQAEVTAGNKGSGTTTKIADLGTIPDAIRTVFKTATFREYTYPIDKKGQNQGIPHPYSCTDTFTHTLDQDIRTLSLQIANYATSIPNPDIYLVTHSLGGDVAFGYVAGLIENASGVSLPSGASLKAVITLDSPLGGVHDSNYLTAARYIFQTPKITFHIGIFSHTIDNPAFCKGLKSNQFTSPTELTKIFPSASKTTHVDDAPPFVADPQGAAASILADTSIKVPSPLPFPSPLGNPLPANEELAEQAQTQFGTSFLSIGNLNDFLWKPSTCVSWLNEFAHAGLPTKPTIPDFIATQWLEDEGNGFGLYGRDFTAGFGTCGALALNNGLNHGEVLTNAGVKTGIEKFLTPPGSTPSPLAVPSGIQPEP